MRTLSKLSSLWSQSGQRWNRGGKMCVWRDWRKVPDKKQVSVRWKIKSKLWNPLILLLCRNSTKYLSSTLQESNRLGHLKYSQNTWVKPIQSPHNLQPHKTHNNCSQPLYKSICITTSASASDATKKTKPKSKSNQQRHQADSYPKCTPRDHLCPLATTRSELESRNRSQ